MKEIHVWLAAEYVTRAGPMTITSIRVEGNMFDPQPERHVIVEITDCSVYEEEDYKVFWDGTWLEWHRALTESMSRPSFPPKGWTRGPVEQSYVSGDKIDAKSPDL